jgi:hypothetical protein
MKLYPIPGGTWAGTEADWKREMKAKGLNPKEYPNPTREVPVAKKELMEFLTFFAVDVYRLPGGAAPTVTATAQVDVDALRALHNPTASDIVAAAQPAEVSALAAATGDTNLTVTSTELAALFEAAPIRVQAELLVGFADRAVARSG